MNLFLFEDDFFKTYSLDEQGLLKAFRTNHKYVKKEGEGKNAKYFYKEKEMNETTFHHFMQDQIQAMKDFREKLTQRLGHDPGDRVYPLWIRLFSRGFRIRWMKLHNMLLEN